MRSEFRSAVQVIGSRLACGGPFSVPPLGLGLTSSLPAITWLIERDGVSVSNTMVHDGTSSTWEDVVDAPEGLTAGPARAYGVVVVVTPDGVESLAWQSDVVIERDP